MAKSKKEVKEEVVVEESMVDEDYTDYLKRMKEAKEKQYESK